MEILLSWSLMILSLSLFGWEEHKMMLSKLIKMNSSKWWRCNGGSQWRRSNSDEQCLYKDYWNGKCKCNLVDPKQWLEIATILFSFPSRKNLTNKSQITILDNCSSRMKMNMEVVNAFSNLWNMFALFNEFSYNISNYS
jgi:hypothetical protein